MLTSVIEVPATSPPFRFVVSLMPFEKKLLESVLFVDMQLGTDLDQIQHDWRVRFLEEQVFPRWAPVLKIKKELKSLSLDLRKSLSNPDIIPAVPSHLRERANYSFFGSLHAPSGTNKCRAQLAQSDNPDFENHVMEEPDLPRFLDSIALSAHDVDLRSWKIIAAMTRRLPTEMSQ